MSLRQLVVNVSSCAKDRSKCSKMVCAFSKGHFNCAELCVRPAGNLTANPGGAVSLLKFSFLIKIKLKPGFKLLSRAAYGALFLLGLAQNSRQQTRSHSGLRQGGRGPAVQARADSFICGWEQRSRAGAMPSGATAPSSQPLRTHTHTGELDLGQGTPPPPPLHSTLLLERPPLLPDGGKGRS